MITIKKDLLNQIIAHAKKDLPNEACGYLAGNDDVVTYSYQLTNVDHSPEHFSFDPSEQFTAVKDARSKGLQILANYHSHPETPSRPSQEDIRLAYDPEIGYVIISLATAEPVVKSFRISNGSATNEDLMITD
jgi:proteasome lid subunit RPN8/RPN11